MNADTSAGRRSQALQRHWKNPARIAKVKADVLSALQRDASGKEIAAQAGVSHGIACRWAWALGYRMMYVTDEERAHLVARRQNTAKEAA